VMNWRPYLSRPPPNFQRSVRTVPKIPAKSLDLKDLRVKYLKINDLRAQRALKTGLGQLRRPSRWTDLQTAPIRLYFRARLVLSQFISESFIPDRDDPW